MKKTNNFIKKVGCMVLASAMVIGLTKLAINAWDNTMTDEEIVYYLNTYPESKDLQKLALRRNLIQKNEIRNDVWCRADSDVDGHCDLSKLEDYEKADRVIETAIYLSESTGKDFEECLAFAEKNIQ